MPLHLWVEASLLFCAGFLVARAVQAWEGRSLRREITRELANRRRPLTNARRLTDAEAAQLLEGFELPARPHPSAADSDAWPLTSVWTSPGEATARTKALCQEQTTNPQVNRNQATAQGANAKKSTGAPAKGQR